MSFSLQPSGPTDLASIATMMNAAFRGTANTKGWSTEEGYITGARTNESLLRDEIAGGAVFLLAKDDETQALRGCVSLQAQTPDKWYLGSLTVDPTLQNAGFGRQLLAAAEEYARQSGALCIEMTVVNLRETLIAWYERRGYRQTGETRPFPYGDDRFGTPTRDDLAFVVLQKDFDLL